MTSSERQPGQSVLIRWLPRWRLSRWVVFVEEWRCRPLDGDASTTGRYFEASPPLWLWMRFLRALLGSQHEILRSFAANRWRRIEVTYWYPEGTEAPDFRAQPKIGGSAPARKVR